MEEGMRYTNTHKTKSSQDLKINNNNQFEQLEKEC